MLRTWRPERDRHVLVVIDTGRSAAGRVGDAPRLDAALDTALLKGTGASDTITGFINQAGVQEDAWDPTDPDSLLDAIGLAVAAVVAVCNAMSSARLAALYPQSGGTYVYGRERLNPFWGHTAGWSFILGKTASCAAMALTVGSYVWPAYANAVAVASVVALTAVGYAGIQRSATLTRIIVALVLALLATVVVVVLGFGSAETSRLALGDDVSAYGVLQAAGLLFFAFAGYARIATLGEEVRDPTRTIPRAIPIALAMTLAVYAIVAATSLAVLGPGQMAASVAPLTDVARASGVPAMVIIVGVGGAVAALDIDIAEDGDLALRIERLARERLGDRVAARRDDGDPQRVTHPEPWCRGRRAARRAWLHAATGPRPGAT